jgi:hypothetical protein
MSDRAMEMAMELFRSNAEFQARVRNSADRGATVDSILREYAPPSPGEKFAGAADDGLTADEQKQINDLPWDRETDDQLIARIGQQGCTYT